jgi:hypothetical protein
MIPSAVPMTLTNADVDDTAWWRQPVRFFQHLLREIDAQDLDADALLEEVRAVGAGGYIAMGGGFSAWYPTKLGCQRINPHLSGDFVGDVLAAARRAGIRTILRMDISKSHPQALHEHPHWLSYGEDGAPHLMWEMPQTCATGDFWQQENFAILSEILERYPVDGFFYNFLNVRRCHCNRCQKLVRAATGAGVPPEGVRTPAYERWRQRYLADYMARVRSFVRQRSPEAVLIPYHHVRDGWDYRSMAEVSDIVGAQVSNPLAANPIDPQPQWNHWAAEEALASRAVKPDVPALLIQTGSEFFASRQTAMPSGRMLRNLIQVAAHGANTAPALNGRLEQDDPRSLPSLLEFGRYQVANAHWYRGLRSLARVAVVRSQDSLDWGPDAGRPAGDVLAPGHVAEFRGVYEMLVQLRYPCDVVPTGDLARAGLERYAAVVLPAVSCIGAADRRAIDRYVAAGGHLIASADVARCDQDGSTLQEPGLECLPYHPGVPRSIFGGYFELSELRLQAAFGDIPHIGADGDFWTLERAMASNELSVDLRLIGPFRNNAPEFTVVRGPGTAPGLLRRMHGNGSATWLTWRPGALYHFNAIPEYATLLGHLLDPLVGSPPIRSGAPSAVEFVLYAHPHGQVLHAINGAAVQGKPLVETAPLAGFHVHVTSKATALRRLDLDAPLAFERVDDEVVFYLDRLDAFAAVALIEGPDEPPAVFYPFPQI